MFVGFFAILTALTLRNLLAPADDPQFKAIRKAGYPVTLAELNDYYTAVAKDQNAALLYQRAFESELFTNGVAGNLTSNLVFKRGEPLIEGFGRDLLDELTNHAAAYRLLYAATNCPGSRYPLDMRQGFTLLLPHLAKVKQAAALLSLEALIHASAGESNQA